MKRSKIVRAMMAFVLTVAVMLGIGVATSAPASAGTPYLYSYSSFYVPLQSAPGGYVTQWLPTPSPAYMVCWTDSYWKYGNYWTNRWFYIRSGWSGAYGWISASYVGNQIAVRHC